MFARRSVRLTNGRLTSTGRVNRAAFVDWMTTAPGHKAVTATASRIRFSITGKQRAARRRLWRELKSAVSDPRVTRAMEVEVDRYTRRLGELAFADGLPRVGINLHRLVVVPHVLLNGAAYRGMSERIGALPPMRASEESAALRDFLFLLLISDCEVAVARAKPSPARPLASAGPWISVGVNTKLVWREFPGQPTWAGHHYVLELSRDPLTRKVRKAIASAIDTFERTLPTLGSLERSEILRRASALACA
jgi:hypothetical protein